MALTVCVSAAAGVRLARARELVRAQARGVAIVGASRGAADDLARSVAAGAPATFGIQRFSLTQLAARIALRALAAGNATPGTRLGAEAAAARAAFEAARAGSLTYFGPVAAAPGFPRALARTLEELRLSSVDVRALAALPLGGADLADLLERFEACVEAAASSDRATLMHTAARLARDAPPAPALVLLDLPLEHAAEREFVAALIAGASAALATVPAGDRELAAWFERQGGTIEALPPSGNGDLSRVQQFLFQPDAPAPDRTGDGSLELFSAPGEGREAVEIARRMLREARRGVPFDEIAVLVRAPQNYFGLIEHALRRAGIPGWFDRGTRRPHPAGRAFLALLACRAERLSAARFAEYLSLGQVPPPGAPLTDVFATSPDDVFARGAVPDPGDDEERDAPAAGAASPDQAPVEAGTLRAPWRWEALLVEAAVIGQDAGRWRRRLDGLAAELQRRAIEAARHDGDDSPKAAQLARVREQLDHLRAFALPIVDALAEWPERATWGEWLARFEALAPRVLRTPRHVLRVLADLRPMAEVGPIDLDEARRVLADRLLSIETEPPARRFGRVFVGTPHQARGRRFRVVFVPGLAERLFPQPTREDPLLLDDQRTTPGLMAEAAGEPGRRRLAAERLLLQLAAGAASERLYVSYPRLELSEARARVPSFYALDVMRAATGRVPDHEWLEARARDVGRATLAWPAPPDPGDAIDDQEYDLAVLRRLLDESDAPAVRGHAHFLLKLNDWLRRSVVDRWARGERRWSAHDGLTRRTARTAPILDARRLTVRPSSPTALQRFSACPYQFLLASFYRLQPLDRLEPLQRMDPLTRGSLFHDMQARFLRALAARGGLPLAPAALEGVRALLDATIDDVAARAHADLAPAVERIWADDIAAIRRDLHAWLEHLARDGDEWTPKHFELAFGPVPGERDPASLPDPVTLEGGFRLRGAIDLVEEHRPTRVLRVTDHKTGRRPERIEQVIVGGGAVLQPVLYAMAAEAALGTPVVEGRLFYCTSAGGFTSHAIPLTPRTRAAGLEALQVIDRAIERGFLPAAPGEEACSRCDFRPVCGRDVIERVAGKPPEPLADLLELRSRP